jgi:insertion element IS1 protein InsB
VNGLADCSNTTSERPHEFFDHTREQATFHTDQYEVYKGVIPAEQHRAITKKARKTNHIERFNTTLRQRVSRLVRDTLSFSKKLVNHIGAIKYFICHYHLTKAAFPV